VIDCRDSDEIESTGDAIAGHVHIPWAKFEDHVEEYKRNCFIRDVNTPILVYCAVGFRSGFLKKELEETCGFSRVFNCENSSRIKEAWPDLSFVQTPNDPYKGELAMIKIEA
jgi:rhodanese-related sulfurtransferase